ncbi:hypothetical protein [Pseudoxanthomonas sp. X-1]|uniref:hypothetical protein n=1 Tax=Pseudoxanthomonas sp. X-1 TaxID=2571115 RepID=UPI0014860010|nr:hypothetical protein [Pseudoxanthomonas sp. X-1]UAY75198.1 hypothetical protein LAJ50_02735 [Pseudoxanthomonas sp. X-1]
MRLLKALDRLLWEITARNWMGWPTERRHRLTGEYEHIRYNDKVAWQPGRLPYLGGPYG